MTPIEYAALVAAVAQGVPAVVALLQSVGCAISGCPKDEPAPAPLPDLASKYRDDADELAREAAGISKR